MTAGRLSFVFGVTQIPILVISHWVLTAWGHQPYAILMGLFGVAMLASAILAAVSLYRRESPIWWAVIGLTVTLFWVLGYTAMWVLSAVS